MPTTNNSVPPAAGEAAHTPTPWHIARRHSDPDTNASLAEILPESGGCWGEWSSQEICALHGARIDTIQAANAAFIVKAANAHAALVAALEAAQLELEANRVAMVGPEWASQRTLTGGALIWIARALKLASGE